MGHRHCSNRYARRDAGRDDLRLELRAMCAPPSTPSADFVGNSVHMSTKNSVDTSIPKPSIAIKVPRRDAYVKHDSCTDQQILTRRLEKKGDRSRPFFFGGRTRQPLLAYSPLALSTTVACGAASTAAICTAANSSASCNAIERRSVSSMSSLTLRAWW